MSKTQNANNNLLKSLFHWGVVFTAFCAPFILLPETLTLIKTSQMAFIQTSGVILLFISTLSFSVNSPLIIRNPFYIPIFALSFWSIISLQYAPNKYEGLMPLTHWLGSFLFFLLITQHCQKKENRTHLLAALFLAGAITALIGIGQHLTNINWFPQSAPPAATFLNRNLAVHFIVLTIPLGFFFSMTNKRRTYYLLSFILTSLMFVYLIYTGSRAGWVAIGMELTLFIILLRKMNIVQTEKHFWNRSKSFALLLSLIILFIFINLDSKGFSWNINKIAFHATSITKTSTLLAEKKSLTSTGLRLTFWANSTAMIKDHFLFGVGIGNFKIIYPLYSQRVAKDPIFSYRTQLLRAHNDFLQAFAELGLIGLILIAFFAIKIFQITFKTLNQRRSSLDRFAVITSFVSIVGISINACFSFPFQRPIPPFVFMSLLGIIASVYSGVDKKHFTLPVERRYKIYALVISALLLIITVHFHSKSIQFDRLANQMSISEKNELWTELISQGRTAFEKFPNHVSYLSVLGRAFMANGMYLQATQTLDSSLEFYPNSLNDLMNHGLASVKTGNYQQAISSFKRVLEIKPDLYRPYIIIAKIYEKQNNFDSALQEYLNAKKINPRDSLLFYNIGALHIRRENYLAAEEAFKKMLELDQNSAIAHKNLGIIYHQFLDNPQTARKHLRRALELKSDIHGVEQIRAILQNQQ